MESIDFQKVDKKWQTFWLKKGTNLKKKQKGKKFYCLEMFP